jgi:hypothetical protein
MELTGLLVITEIIGYVGEGAGVDVDVEVEVDVELGYTASNPV